MGGGTTVGENVAAGAQSAEHVGTIGGSDGRIIQGRSAKFRPSRNINSRDRKSRNGIRHHASDTRGRGEERVGAVAGFTAGEGKHCAGLHDGSVAQPS